MHVQRELCIANWYPFGDEQNTITLGLRRCLGWVAPAGESNCRYCGLRSGRFIPSCAPRAGGSLRRFALPDSQLLPREGSSAGAAHGRSQKHDGGGFSYTG